MRCFSRGPCQEQAADVKLSDSGLERMESRHSLIKEIRFFVLSISSLCCKVRNTTNKCLISQAKTQLHLWPSAPSGVL